MTSFSDLLTAYQPADDQEAAMKRQLQQFIATSDNAYSRDNLTAHVVADAWIVNPTRTHVLLVEHTLNKHWMAPGGHCDGSDDVIDVARREAFEEAGISDLKLINGGQIFDIQTGYVPARVKPHGIEPLHLHFDVCFAFEGDDSLPLLISNESTDLKWVALSDIPQINFWSGHQRRPGKTARLA